MSSSTSLRLKECFKLTVFKLLWETPRSYRAASGIGRKQDGEAMSSLLLFHSRIVALWCVLLLKGPHKILFEKGGGSYCLNKIIVCRLVIFMLLLIRKVLVGFSDTGTKPHESILLIYKSMRETETSPSSSHAQAAGRALHMMGTSKVLAECMLCFSNYIYSTSYPPLSRKFMVEN